MRPLPVLLPLLVLTCSACGMASTPRPAAAEPPVVIERPADPAAAARWYQAPWALAVPEGPDGRTVLRIAVPTAAASASAGAVQQDVFGRAIALQAGRYEVSRGLDLADLRGWRVDLTVRLRWAGVPRPAVPWEGVRLAVGFQGPACGHGASLNGLWGDRGWHEETLRLRIPADATAAAVQCGLIAAAGAVWIDEVRVARVEPPLAAQIRPGWTPPAAQRRGTGMGGTHDGWIGRVAREWGANIVKLWIRLPRPDQEPAAYDAELDKVLDKLAGDLAQAEAAGVAVIPQISAPGDTAWVDATLGGTHRMYLDPAIADRFVATWERIARRFAGKPTVWGYDLLNETVLRVPPAAGCPDWEGLAERAARAINAIDPRVRIIVQPEEWWGMRTWEKMRPIAAANVVYSLHMYEPFALTHQGVGTRKPEGVRYPGTIDGVTWDKARLRQAMQGARDFQLAHRVPMQVGEFSCIRWAPDGSAGRWLADCTALFEEYGWDFTYHGCLDWDGWSVEMGEDPADQRFLTAPGAAKRALMEAMARNRAPAGAPTGP